MCWESQLGEHFLFSLFSKSPMYFFTTEIVFDVCPVSLVFYSSLEKAPVLLRVVLLRSSEWMLFKISHGFAFWCFLLKGKLFLPSGTALAGCVSCFNE